MKENFDDILKRKWEEKHFPVDETHRAEMIQLLNGKKRRRIIPIWWFGGVLVFMTVNAYFLMSDQDGPIIETATQVETPVTGLPTSPEEPISGISNTSGNSNEVNTSDNQNKEADRNSVDASSHQSKLDTNTISNPSTKSGKAVESKSTTPSSSKIQNNTSTTKGQSKGAAKTSVPLMTFNAESGKVTKELNESSGPTLILDQISSVEKENQAGSISDAQDISKREILEPCAFLDPLGIQDILYHSEYSIRQIEPSFSSRKSFYLFGEAGTGIVLGSKPDFTSGWKLRAGGGLGCRLNSKFQLTWAAGYLMQDGGFEFERTSTVDFPGFGVRSSFNSLTPDRLHFVYSKIGGQYRLRRHVFALHGGAQWLYGAQGTVVVHTTDEFVADATTSSKYAWLKTDGLRKLNWTADISYGYQFTPRISLMAGTDVYFSSFTVEDPDLAKDGYYWAGKYAALHPFITLNYLIHGRF